MNTTRELKNRKIMSLAMQFMRMANEDTPYPIFDDLEWDEDENEISFIAASSQHIAIEMAMHICLLFNLTLCPAVGGTKVLYTILGN